MTALCEGLMLACFGLSWPINVAKSLRARSAKGKSVFFEIVIIAGYLFGIAGKFYAGSVNFILALYFINLLVVSIDLGLTIRNKRLDAERDAEEASLTAALREDEAVIGKVFRYTESEKQENASQTAEKNSKKGVDAVSSVFIPSLAEESLRQLR